MGRRPTKAVDNPFCKARLEAASYNDRLFSKKGHQSYLEYQFQHCLIMNLV